MANTNRPRTGLLAFHAVMAVVYLLIIWAFKASHPWLAFALWLAAFVFCVTLLVGCGLILLRNPQEPVIEQIPPWEQETVVDFDLDIENVVFVLTRLAPADETCS